MLPDLELLKLGWQCQCPKCKQGDLYEPGITLNLKKNCDKCGLDLEKNDSADGPAVFLIFILGFLLVPLALVLDSWLSPPLWVHAVLWTAVALTITLGALRPLKAYIIALQYRHRPKDFV